MRSFEGKCHNIYAKAVHMVSLAGVKRSVFYHRQESGIFSFAQSTL